MRWSSYLSWNRVELFCRQHRDGWEEYGNTTNLFDSDDFSLSPQENEGRKQKIAASYLTSHRIPWYSQEQRPPAPFLCTYMGRQRNGKHPFRFLWNRSQATAHNVYLMLYPKGRLREALKKQPDLEERVFEALQRITPAQFVSEGRVYGGGLHKVEPKELAQIPAVAVLDCIKAHVSIEKQGSRFA